MYFPYIVKSNGCFARSLCTAFGWIFLMVWWGGVVITRKVHAAMHPTKIYWPFTSSLQWRKHRNTWRCSNIPFPLSILLHYWHLSPHAYNASRKIRHSFCLVNLNTTVRFRSSFPFSAWKKGRGKWPSVRVVAGTAASGDLVQRRRQQWKWDSRDMLPLWRASCAIKMLPEAHGAAFWCDCNIFQCMIM